MENSMLPLLDLLCCRFIFLVLAFVAIVFFFRNKRGPWRLKMGGWEFEVPGKGNPM